MATLWWGAAALLTVAGALLFWGARVLAAESFYVDASLLLFLALLLAGLSHL
jgi:ABC-type branched-subunit amino acid transport system permease subunit